MSRASQIIVLCEDKAHDVFITRFLKKAWRWKGRDFRVRSYPRDAGSGKKHVQDKVGEEVNALRSRHASTVLLVAHDADEKSVEQVKALLNEKIAPRRGDNEPIAYIMPKWHIETWIAYLDGQSVDESDRYTYKQKYGEIAESKRVHPHVDQLACHCRDNRELESPPHSLVEACKEFDRIRGLL